MNMLSYYTIPHDLRKFNICPGLTDHLLSLFGMRPMRYMIPIRQCDIHVSIDMDFGQEGSIPAGSTITFIFNRKG